MCNCYIKLYLSGKSKLKGGPSSSPRGGLSGNGTAPGDCHPALTLFLSRMRLSVSPVGVAAYILRRGTGTSGSGSSRDRDRDASSGPEDLLRVGVFRSMVAALIRGEAGSKEGIESSIAIFRMDIAVLNRSSQAQRVCYIAPSLSYYASTSSRILSPTKS
jgi:hypothetical protein